MGTHQSTVATAAATSPQPRPTALVVRSLAPITCARCHHHHPGGPSSSAWQCDGDDCSASLWHRPNAPCCRRCRREFGLVHQRHKCRVDGHAYCSTCCPQELQAAFPVWGESEEQHHRICKGCALRLQLRASYHLEQQQHHDQQSPSSSAQHHHHHHLYVPARVQREIHEEDANNNSSKTGEMLFASQLADHLISAASASASSHHNSAILQGPSGSGATTCLRHLAAEQRCEDALLVLVQLPDLVRALKAQPPDSVASNSAAFVLSAVAPDHIVSSAQREQLAAMPIAWLVDGIAEVEDDSDKQRALAAIVASARFSVVAAGEDVSIVSVMHTTAAVATELWALQRWNDDEVKLFCIKFLHSKSSSSSSSRAEAAVLRAMHSSSMERVAGLPLFVHLLCEVAEHPSGLELLAPTKKQHHRLRCSPTRLLEVFCELRWRSALGGAGGVQDDDDEEAFERQVHRLNAAMEDAGDFAFSQLSGRPDGSSWREQWAAAGLVDATPPAAAAAAAASSSIHFPHRILPDFLAARSIAIQPDEDGGRLAAALPMWNAKHSNVLMFLADFARRASNESEADEDEQQEEQDELRPLLLLHHDIYNLSEAAFAQHVASIYSKAFVATVTAPGALRQPVNVLTERTCVRQLLSITTSMSPKACRTLLRHVQEQLLDAPAAGDKILSIHLALLTEFFAVEGALTVFHWLEHRMSSATATAGKEQEQHLQQQHAAAPLAASLKLLQRAMLRALDHQREHKSVAACINEIIDKYEIEFATLEDAIESGSLSAVARALVRTDVVADSSSSALSHATIVITRERMFQLTVAALRERRFDTAAMLLLKLGPLLRNFDSPEYHLLAIVVHFALPDTVQLPFTDFSPHRGATPLPAKNVGHEHFVLRTTPREKLVEFLLKQAQQARLSLWQRPRSDRQLTVPRETLSILLARGVVQEVRRFSLDKAEPHIIVAGPRGATSLTAMDIVGELQDDEDEEEEKNNNNDDLVHHKNASSAVQVIDDDEKEDSAAAAAKSDGNPLIKEESSTSMYTHNKSALEQLIFNGDANPHLRHLRISVPMSESHQLQVRYLNFAAALWSNSLEHLELGFLRQDVAARILSFHALKELVLTDPLPSVWHRVQQQQQGGGGGGAAKFPALEKLTISDTRSPLSAADAVALVRPFRESLVELTYVRQNLHVVDKIVDVIVHELGFLKPAAADKKAAVVGHHQHQQLYHWPRLQHVSTVSFDKEAVAQTKYELGLRKVHWDHSAQEYEHVEKPTSFYF